MYPYAINKRRALPSAVRVFFAFILILGILFMPITSDADETRPTVILDAGHGGEDGGAVGKGGVREKDLNLTITLRLAELLREAGVDVILTRDEDRLLYKEEENIKGHRKEYDLKNRLAVAEENPEALFISIHMNTFSSPRYAGLQVYYAKTAGSQALAESIQSTVREQLQPENTRKIHAASSSIYLLDKAVGRAVLVECGFLSNEAECERLTQKDYQDRLCFSLFCGIMKYIESAKGEAS